MRVLVLAWLVTLGLTSVTTTAQAAEPIGAAAKVEDTLNGPSGKLVTGASIYFNDKLSTDATGVGQIVFNDGTKLALGPNAQVTIDKFVYKADGTFGELAVSMTKGAFRWISGKSKPEAYKLSTGWANLAIRGTAFDVNVDPEGQLTLVLYEGAVTVCLANGDCREIAGRCQYIATETKLQVDDPSKLRRPKARALKESGKFPFIDNDKLIEPFHIANASCKVRKVQKQRKAERTKRSRSRQTAARSTRSKVATVATVSTAEIARATEGRGSRAATPDPGPPSTPDPPAPDLSPKSLPDPVDPATPTVEGPKVDPGKKRDDKGHYGKGHYGKGHHGKGHHGKGHKGTGNPGNDSDNGNAGESPSGGDFGDGSTGNGDSSGKGGKGRGKGGAGGHGQGSGQGDG